MAQRSGQSVEVLETRTLLAAQIIQSGLPRYTVAAGETVEVSVSYQTTNDDGEAAALKSDRLSFNLHFDADVLTWISTNNLFAEGIQDIPDHTLLESDAIVVGDDQDLATETVLLTSYASPTGWPANPSVALQVLYVARFTANPGFSGTTIKFSANHTGTVIGQNSNFMFDSSSVNIVTPDNAKVSIADAPAVTEGANSLFTVSLSSAQSTTVTVKYSTEDGMGPSGALSSEDYTAQVGELLTFAPGETVKTISIATTVDSLVEAQEEFRVRLHDEVGVDLGLSQAIGKINNNVGGGGLPALSIEDAAAVTEGGNATFIVTMDRAASTPVTVTYSTTDSDGPTGAINGEDLIAQTDQVLTFAVGETQKTITVVTIDDTVIENAEEFGVTLSNATGAEISTPSATGTINDNDSGPPTFSIADAPTITEGNSAVFTVTLSPPSSGTVTVNYSTQDDTGPADARDGIDFNGQTNQTLTFAAGETVKTITVSTIDDAVEETSETFEVLLHDSVGAGISTTKATGIGTISDNDTIPTFPGDIDGDSDFDANDSFLIQLVKLSGTDAQIDQSKGGSTLTATQIRTGVNQLAVPGDVDGDSDFDANDAFLIHLVKLSGTNTQIDQVKGTSPLTAAQIRANVNALGGGPASSSVVSRGSEVVQSVMASAPGSDDATGLFANDEQDAVAMSASTVADTQSNNSSTSVWEDFRGWIDAI
ncbi:MAG: Calx-beta domain-containing protein [Fuerstiella sp.]